MTTSAAPAPATRRPRGRRGVVLGVLGALVTFAAPGLVGGPAASAAPLPGRIAFGDAGVQGARTFANLRAATRPGVLALQAARTRPAAAARSAPAVGATTTYFAMQPGEYGSARMIRFRTDGRAHVSGRTVVVPAAPDVIVAPTSVLGWTLVAMEVGYDGQNVVTVDGRGRAHRLTHDGRSSYGMITPGRRVVFVTNNDRGEADGLAEVDLSGWGRRIVFREKDPNAVLSLPALSPDGRTAYLVRNVFDRRGLPQSALLSIDVRSGRSTSRPLPGINYVTSVSASSNGRELGFVGYREADNLFARWFGFRAEADVLPVSGGPARRVAWVDQPFTAFSRGGSRLIVGAEGRLVSVGVTTSQRDPLYGTEGLSLPVLAR